MDDITKAINQQRETELCVAQEDGQEVFLNPEMLDFYRDLSDRVYWLTDDIDTNTLGLVKDIIRFNMDDAGVAPSERTPIKIMIACDGGDLSVTYQIINAIRISKTPVYTVNCHRAFSGAASILAAGHKRFALPGTSVMIHTGYCHFDGEVEKVESCRRFYDKMSEKLFDALFASTNIDKKSFRKKHPATGTWTKKKR